MNGAAVPAVRVPTVRAALRASGADFYYQSLRLVPANLAWGAALLAVLAIGVWISPLAALALAPLLALPLVGVSRLAAQVARGCDVVLSDVAVAVRAYAVPALAAAVIFEVATIVIAANVAGGISAGGPIGWAFATLSAWGLVAVWIFGLAFWPLLVDPAREAAPVATRARLAALAILARPTRFAYLGGALAVVALISAVAFAALLSVSVAFISLVASRVTLPAADELETPLARTSATADPLGHD